MAKTKSQQTLKVLEAIKTECNYLEDSVLGEIDPDDAEIMLRVLRLMNNRDGRRATFLYHVVMEFNEGSITITPPPPGKTDPPSPPTDGQSIIIEESEPTRQTRRAKKGDDTELLKTGQPIALSRGLAHRTDGVHVEVSPERRRTLQETHEDLQRRLAERRKKRSETG